MNEIGNSSIANASDKKGVAKGFSADVVQAAISNRPVILLGDVGAGKSTFIERLIHVDAEDVLGESVCIYVDFGASSALSSLSEHVLQACVDQLREKYATNVLSTNFVEKRTTCRTAPL